MRPPLLSAAALAALALVGVGLWQRPDIAVRVGAGFAARAAIVGVGPAEQLVSAFEDLGPVEGVQP